MTIEELLRPRYLVIANWPRSAWTVGRIIEGNYISDLLKSEVCMRKYPHLFRPLQWWEMREEEDMPEYVKVKTDCQIINRLYNKGSVHKLRGIKLDTLGYSFFEPATLKEYTTYINQLNK